MVGLDLDIDGEEESAMSIVPTPTTTLSLDEINPASFDFWLRDDVEGDCEWHAPVPGTDVAIMLALAHVLATESLADREFLSTYCTGYDRFERYLLGLDDGIAKSPRWASEICGLPADTIREYRSYGKRAEGNAQQGQERHR